MARKVKFFDKYVREHGACSRSVALHEAVDLLRAAQLADAYEDAWTEWAFSGDAEVWGAVLTDGLGD